MLRRVLAGCGVVVAFSMMAGGAWGANFAFTGAADRSGDLSGPLAIANDFIVTGSNGINVTQLGLFVDGFSGISGPSESHVVSLFNRSSPSTPIATVTFSGSWDSSDGPYAYNNPANSQSPALQTQGGWIYLNIPTTFLPNGFQGSVVAYDMSDGGEYIDDYGESVPFNSGGGLISFNHSFHNFTSATTATLPPTAAPRHTAPARSLSQPHRRRNRPDWV